MGWDGIDTAAAFRDIVSGIVERTIDALRPQSKLGKVYSYTPGAPTAKVLFAGETVNSLVTVDVPTHLQPQVTMDTTYASAGYAAVSDLVRCCKGLGGWYIDQFVYGIPKQFIPALPLPLPTGFLSGPTDGTWFTIGATGQPAFQNSWVNFDSTRVVQYMRFNGVVFLRGLAKSGTIGTTVFNLPSGYRPAFRALYDTYHPVVSNSAFGAVTVHGSDGQVRIDAGSNTWVSFDGIKFIAEN